jgi:hypothetical protein
MVKRSPRPPCRDPFLDTARTVGDYVRSVVEAATWRLTFGCAFAIIGRMLPLPKEDLVTHVLLVVFALNLGAVLGRPLDRRPSVHRRRRRR